MAEGESRLQRVPRGPHKGKLQKVSADPKTSKRKVVTAEQYQLFLEHLAESSNVQASARAAGISGYHVYGLRRNNAQFRHDWDQALYEGYNLLHMEALRRARFGDERTETVKDEVVRVVHSFDNRLTATLLSLHRATAERVARDVEEAPPPDPAELAAKLRAALRIVVPEDDGAA